MAAIVGPADGAPEAAPSPSAPSNPPQLEPSPSMRRTALARPSSHASRNRASQYSTHSVTARSRPPSHIPIFFSSLPYTLVRDFAYPAQHPFHYGPPPESSQPPSGRSTPASEPLDRFYDPPTSWDRRDSWESGEQLVAVQYADGPPWSEDEDLQSPVVTVNRHRRHRTGGGDHGRGRGRSRRGDGERPNSLLSQGSRERDRALFLDTGGEGSERYYAGEGELVTYPPDHARPASHLSAPHAAGQRDSHFAAMLPSRTYTDETGQGYASESDASSTASSPGISRRDESRYSRDYQFTIASPDEEMHGKAVALFDFERENENELPLVEGQVIWVSYRHGQGWLVAKDPKTEESGLVPEEYVRMLRDIQGGLNSLAGIATEQILSPVGDVGTPTQAQHNQSFASTPSNGNGYQQPIVSTFSTSSKDLNPYPQHLLGTQAGQAPPQVIHYHGQRGGSQANTPTISTAQEGDSRLHAVEDGMTPIATSLPHTKLGEPLLSPTSPSSDSTEEGFEADAER